jgi:uncharacterized MAPEG superfamily protein
MNATATPELFWLTCTALLTALLWIPYTARLIVEMGPVAAFWDPYHETPLRAAWAQRAKRAHLNAVENLAVFAPLVLAIHLLGLGTPATALASGAFFALRIVHAVAYTAGVPLVRTLIFLAGFACQVILAARLLGA